jgi:hypothetical protein
MEAPAEPSPLRRWSPLWTSLAAVALYTAAVAAITSIVLDDQAFHFALYVSVAVPALLLVVAAVWLWPRPSSQLGNLARIGILAGLALFGLGSALEAVGVWGWSWNGSGRYVVASQKPGPDPRPGRPGQCRGGGVAGRGGLARRCRPGTTATRLRAGEPVPGIDVGTRPRTGVGRWPRRHAAAKPAPLGRAGVRATAADQRAAGGAATQRASLVPWLWGRRAGLAGGHRRRVLDAPARRRRPGCGHVCQLHPVRDRPGGRVRTTMAAGVKGAPRPGRGPVVRLRGGGGRLGLPGQGPVKVASALNVRVRLPLGSGSYLGQAWPRGGPTR